MIPHPFDSLALAFGEVAKAMRMRRSITNASNRVDKMMRKGGRLASRGARPRRLRRLAAQILRLKKKKIMDRKLLIGKLAASGGGE